MSDKAEELACEICEELLSPCDIDKEDCGYLKGIAEKIRKFAEPLSQKQGGK